MRISDEVRHQILVREPRRLPHPREHRDRGEPRHRVHLIDDDRAGRADEEVDPREALAAERLERQARLPLHFSLDRLVEVCRHDEVRGIIEVLRLEVVELMIAADDDLGAAARPRHARLVLDHPALNLTNPFD